MLKAPRKPNISKTVVYAIAVNALQILALLVFVVYVFLMDFSWQNRISLRTIAVVGALVAGWGAILDIQDALLTRRRMRTITELQTVNQQMDALNLKLRAQRHDFLNHLQVVYSLMEMGEYQDATAYLETVYSQLHAVSRVLRTKVTAFNALLQVKNAECERRGIALEMDVRSTLEGIAMPAWELCCVIGNLLDNAAKYASADSTVRVILRRQGSHCLLSVASAGDAISKEDLKNIFKRFYRMDKARSMNHSYGLGLSIADSIVSKHGGKIWAESADGVNAFFVQLPTA